MALKHKITAAEHAALADVLKPEYKLVGTEYVLDVDGVEDVGALKRAKDREVQNAADAKKRADALEVELNGLKASLGDDATANARKIGDIATLEKSWQAKLDTEVSARETKLSKREQFIQTSLVDNVAHQIAARISTSPAVILPHIKARLSADLSGDEPVTRVIDSMGKPSALSVADLEKEFVTNKDFAAIITVSSGSGGGAPGGKQGGGSAPKKFAEMSGEERITFHKADPAGFARESAAAKSSSVRL